MASTTKTFNETAQELFASAPTDHERLTLCIRALEMLLSDAQAQELADAYADAKNPEPPTPTEPGAQG